MMMANMDANSHTWGAKAGPGGEHYLPAHWTAARMLGGDQGHPSLLNADLFCEIGHADNLCRAVGSDLIAHQTIAVLVQGWRNRHPNIKPYGD